MAVSVGNGKARGLIGPVAPRPLAVRSEALGPPSGDPDEHVCDAETLARRESHRARSAWPSARASARRLPHEVSQTAVMALPQGAPRSMHAPAAPVAPSMSSFEAGMGPFWMRRPTSDPPSSYTDGFASAANTGSVTVRRSHGWLWMTGIASALGGLGAFVAAMLVNTPGQVAMLGARTAPTAVAAGARPVHSTAPVMVVELDAEAKLPAPVTTTTPAASPQAPAAVAPVSAPKGSGRGARAAALRRPLPVVQAPAAAPAPAPASPPAATAAPQREDDVAGAAATHAEGKGIIDSAL